jgi:serine/threonine protein kinase
VNTWSKPALSPGTMVEGQWNKRSYRIVRTLGEGANGLVYLVKTETGFFAMKIGFEALDLQSEINVLKRIAQFPTESEPFLIDADDFRRGSITYPFYVMRYVDGENIGGFLSANSLDWVYVLGCKLLNKLCLLHEHGWVFGDLKPENIIVSECGRVELVDYGGVTQLGRAVKQFTEMYDRGYWGAGSRQADEAYDLFSFAVLFLHLTDSHKRISSASQLPAERRDTAYLIEVARTSPYAERALPFLMKALKGQFPSSREAAAEWRKLMPQFAAADRFAKRPSCVRWIKGFFIASLLVFVSTLVFVLH